MKINILTLFPEYFSSPLQTSIINRARQSGQVEFQIVEIRSFTSDAHKTADDRPYGGGPGMVLKVDVLDKALTSLEDSGLKILTSAKGDLFTQQTAQRYSELDNLTIVCGHYEGVDERVADNLVDEEVRIGDYVLTGGEPAAMVMIDSVVRLLGGVLGNEQSTQGESHSQPGQMGYPQYTRPENYKGWTIPEVLKSGNHAQIKAWRQSQRKKEKNHGQ